MTTLNPSLPRDHTADHGMMRRPVSGNQAAAYSAVILQGRRQPAERRSAVSAAARYAALRALHPEGVCGLELRRPGKDRWVALLPDLSGPPGTFKVQFFDRTGIGHHVGGYASPEAALVAALAAGYTVVATGAFQSLVASPGWQARYRSAVMPAL